MIKFNNVKPIQGVKFDPLPAPSLSPVEYYSFFFATSVSPGAATSQVSPGAFTTWTPKSDVLIRRIHLLYTHVNVAGTTRQFVDALLSLSKAGSAQALNFVPSGIQQPPAAGWTYPATQVEWGIGPGENMIDLTGTEQYIPKGFTYSLVPVANGTFAAGDSIFFSGIIYYKELKQ